MAAGGVRGRFESNCRECRHSSCQGRGEESPKRRKGARVLLETRLRVILDGCNDMMLSSRAFFQTSGSVSVDRLWCWDSGLFMWLGIPNKGLPTTAKMQGPEVMKRLVSSHD